LTKLLIKLGILLLGHSVYYTYMQSFNFTHTEVPKILFDRNLLSSNHPVSSFFTAPQLSMHECKRPFHPITIC